MKLTVLKEKPSFSDSGFGGYREGTWFETMIWRTGERGWFTEIRPLDNVFGFDVESLWLEGKIEVTDEKQIWEVILEAGQINTYLSLLIKQANSDGRESMKNDLKELLSID